MASVTYSNGPLTLTYVAVTDSNTWTGTNTFQNNVIFDANTVLFSGAYTATLGGSGSLTLQGTVTFSSTAAVSVNSTTSWNFNSATVAGNWTASGNVNFTASPTFNTVAVFFNGTQTITFGGNTTATIQGTLSISSTGIINVNGNFDIVGTSALLTIRANDSADKIRVSVTGTGAEFQVSDGTGARLKYLYDDDSWGPAFGLDGVPPLGVSGRKWKEVWATNGTIQTSFSKFKKNIQPQDCNHCLAVCEAMEPITFEWNEEQMAGSKQRDGADRRYFGFNADPLMTMAPEAVAGEDGIYTGAVIGHLLGAIKNLSSRVKELEALKDKKP